MGEDGEVLLCCLWRNELGPGAVCMWPRDGTWFSFLGSNIAVSVTNKGAEHHALHHVADTDPHE